MDVTSTDGPVLVSTQFKLAKVYRNLSESPLTDQIPTSQSKVTVLELDPRSGLLIPNRKDNGILLHLRSYVCIYSIWLLFAPVRCLT